LLPLSSSFLFTSSLPHLHLHSFPTRRSSDLLRQFCQRLLNPGKTLVEKFLFDFEDGNVESGRSRNLGDARAHQTATENADFLDRSEEHTSELQSPYDLVCRLLLEKKKKNTKK